jgi:nitrite reductase/ring-hydroxylating ferredoxin subunit
MKLNTPGRKLVVELTKVLVGKASEFANGRLAHVTAGGKEVLIANIGGKFYATGNTCTHAGAELHEGELKDNLLTCPWHGARWDLTTGNLDWFPQKLKAIGQYKVILENGTVFVEV